MAPFSTSAGTATDQPAATAPRDNGTALLDQYRRMSVTDRFYATTDADNMDFGMAPDEKASFDAAFNSRTLIIQDAADVPLLDDKTTWWISRTGRGGMGRQWLVQWRLSTAARPAVRHNGHRLRGRHAGQPGFTTRQR